MLKASCAGSLTGTVSPYAKLHYALIGEKHEIRSLLGSSPLANGSDRPHPRHRFGTGACILTRISTDAERCFRSPDTASEGHHNREPCCVLFQVSLFERGAFSNRFTQKGRNGVDKTAGGRRVCSQTNNGIA